MNIFSKPWKLILLFVLIFFTLLLLLVVWHRDKPGISQGNGYRLIYDRQDDVYIVKEGEIAVVPTIVDSQRKGNFVAGLRFPIRYLFCGNSSGSKIRILNKRRYFVLDTLKGKLLNFDNREKFEKKLLTLDGFDIEGFNHSKFDAVWNKYSKFYHLGGDMSGCRDFPVGTIEYAKSEVRWKLTKNLELKN